MAGNQESPKDRKLWWLGEVRTAGWIVRTKKKKGRSMLRSHRDCREDVRRAFSYVA